MAFVLDEEGVFPVRVNSEMVELEEFIDPEDQDIVLRLICASTSTTPAATVGTTCSTTGTHL